MTQVQDIAAEPFFYPVTGKISYINADIKY